jgi:hypothetical protein
VTGNRRHAALLHAHFGLRWLLANMLGWWLGLLSGGLVLNWSGGPGGVLLAGTVTGLCVGVTQWLLAPDWLDRRWLFLSALGGGLAVLPAYLTGLVSLFTGPRIGFFVVGAVYGGIFGGFQWLALRYRVPDWLVLWLVANALAGGWCACLTLTFNPLRLPVFCSLGPVAFGLITGWALRRLRQDS